VTPRRFEETTSWAGLPLQEEEVKERKGQPLLAFFVVLPVTSLSILALALPFSDHAYIERASEKGYPRYRE
jgi:hypothetical protein